MGGRRPVLTAKVAIQLARLVEKQSRILGKPVPELVLRVLRGDRAALLR